MANKLTLQIWPAAVVALIASVSPSAAGPALPGMTEGQTILLVGAAFMIICGAIGGYVVYSGLRSRRLAKESELWPTTAGTVLASSVSKRTSSSKHGILTHYAPDVRYSYRVAGTDHECDVIRFGCLEAGSAKLAQDVIDRYPEGATITVRYNPADPSQAALETGSAAGTQIFLGALFTVLPLIIIVLTLVILPTK